MPWLMVYITVAVTVLSVTGACCAKGLRDPGRLAAIIAAAALWPVLVVGLIQFGVIQAVVSYLRRHAPTAGPMMEQPSVEPEPATAPMILVDSLVRLAQQVGVKHPA